MAAECPSLEIRSPRSYARKALSDADADSADNFRLRSIPETVRRLLSLFIFQQAWRAVQSRFVDDPGGALREADLLIAEVMSVEGYPIQDFEQRAADISVNHPRVIDNYREGHTTALKHSHGRATTEELREAMVHYRSLFDELVGHSEWAAERTRT